uniref:Virulence protein RhuM/Fic/DOC family protein n=1 Tax=Roseihalotalea indica TaxID=2867963 RepID=A0AA49JEL1_9BACT|nr:virulence protein RhuM/Fic/DOC family protein [Tunicatimonas sp. TK19036]
MNSSIEIYQSPDNQIALKVSLDQETVWLTQAQMSELFSQTKQNISLHIGNIFKDGELEKDSVVKESLTTAGDGKKYKTKFYNLDVIISVGYRVKSKRGTEFRIWATQRLKDYLVQGYAINESRLAQKQQEVQHLKTGIRILERVISDKAEQEELDWLQHFAKGLQLLDDYDHEQLDKKGNSTQAANYPSLEDYWQVVERMKADFDSAVFGKEKDESFQSSVAQIGKGFGDMDFYPSLEEKAATLLYLIIKNHSFVDGNKRIAAACFLLFLEKNNLLLREDGRPIMSNEALASLTLLVAASKSEEMEIVKQLIISVLNRNAL